MIAAVIVAAHMGAWPLACQFVTGPQDIHIIFLKVRPENDSCSWIQSSKAVCSLEKEVTEGRSIKKIFPEKYSTEPERGVLYAKKRVRAWEIGKIFCVYLQVYIRFCVHGLIRAAKVNAYGRTSLSLSSSCEIRTCVIACLKLYRCVN